MSRAAVVDEDLDGVAALFAHGRICRVEEDVSRHLKI